MHTVQNTKNREWYKNIPYFFIFKITQRGGECILYIIRKVGDGIKISPTFFSFNKITQREGGNAYCT